MTDHDPDIDPLPAQRWTALLERIAAEVQPRAAGFAVAGETWHDELGPPGRAARRRQALARVLYRRYYHGAGPCTPESVAGHPHALAQDEPRWGAALRARLGDRRAWEDGWTLVDAGRRGLLVDASRRGLLVARDGVVVHASAGQTRVRDGVVQVRLPADRPAASPGFFATTSRRGGPSGTGPLVRVYLHLRPGQALDAFADLIASLDGARIRFCAKVVDHLDGFDRPDTAVVYTAREDCPRAVQAAVAVGRRRPGALAPEVPAFTLPLAPGIALAEDPAAGPGVSFGRHRCDLVAAGILDSDDPGTRAGRLAGIRSALRAAGLDLTRLHLSPGSADVELSGPLGGVA